MRTLYNLRLQSFHHLQIIVLRSEAQEVALVHFRPFAFLPQRFGELFAGV